MTNDIYRKLQQRLDHYSLGFPATESGIELKILKKLFSEDDAAMFLLMTLQLETPGQIAQRVGRLPAEVAAQLEDMTERGLLFRLKRGGSTKYGAIGFVHGICEFQLNHMDREFAEMVEQYHEDGFSRTFEKIGGMFLRTVPVEKSIPITHHVAAYDDAVKILRGKESIVVTDCICRKKNELLEKGCGKKLESCFMFGSMGQYYIDRGMGRRVDVDEAVSILREAQDSGLVTQPSTSQNPGGMCNCCGDCCGVLMSLRQHPRPAEIVYSNHFAAIDRETCTGCETCLDRCQMDAIVMNADNLAEIDRNRCIGCGLCIATCPVEAIQLVPKTAQEHMTPPVSTAEQMRTMAKYRGLL